MTRRDKLLLRAFSHRGKMMNREIKREKGTEIWENEGREMVSMVVVGLF